MRYYQQLRQDFIAEYLKEHGRINRADIMEKFGISLPQASHDIQVFRKANPKAMKYNFSKKQYERTK